MFEKVVQTLLEGLSKKQAEGHNNEKSINTGEGTKSKVQKIGIQKVRKNGQST